MIAKPSLARLAGRRVEDPAEALHALAGAAAPDASPDHYGAGPIVEGLERTVAALLGKESAVFCASGRAAQLGALRVHADARGRPVIAAHPRSHIVEDEDDAAGSLYGLRVVRVGNPVAPFGVAEVEAVHEPLGAISVELPLRRAGYRITPWDELVALAAHARSRGAALHLDGARLWEAAPAYGKSPAEIAALADSVYVSFYKGLRGLAGAALAGDAGTVAATRRWIGRAGAILYRLYPYALAAREGLRIELPRMAEYHARACAIAVALRGTAGVSVSPDPPECNAFIVHLEGEHEELLAARDAVAEQHGIALFDTLAATPHPRIFSFELVVGPDTPNLTSADLRAAFGALGAPPALLRATSR